MQSSTTKSTQNLAEHQTRVLTSLWSHVTGYGAPRFARYTTSYGKDALAHYFWNVRVCEAMMPLLNGSEVMLRNTINQVLSRRRGTFWFDDMKMLDERDQKFVWKAREGAKRPDGNGGFLIRSADDVVAEQSFRFWANLLNSVYNHLWNELFIGNAFPNIPATLKDKRATLRSTFATACDIRNRVCHHERIIHLPYLEHSVKDMKRALGWISKPYAGVIRGLCRFDEVWQKGNGHVACYQALCDMLPPPEVAVVPTESVS